MDNSEFRSRPMDDIVLASGDAVARIARRGAELRQWRIGGRELIWTPDAAVWAEAAPILFPVVGWTRGGRARVAGRAYPLGLHGFARASDFNLEESAPDRAIFVLRDSAETQAQYPFGFTLRVEYALSPEVLAVRLHVENSGQGALPYACGLHPGFVWCFDGGAPQDYRIVFDAEEAAAVPVIAPGGLFSRQTRPVPLAGRVLPLSHELFAREALCFLDARSRGLSFERVGGAALRVELSDFPHIALWSRPGAPFLSIEAWTGHGDPEDFDGELADKPSMRLLAPGQAASHAARFCLRQSASAMLGSPRET